MSEVLNDVVVELLARERPGLLLEIPAGGSPVAERLTRMGHRSVEVDLFPAEGFEGVQADACAPLPFRDGAFDVVLTMEGIEHFENPASFLRECSRVLRPGGLLLLTTPNVLHLSGRLSAALTGQRALKRGFVNEDQTLRDRDGERVHHGHAFLIDAFRLRYLMAICGLRWEALAHGKRSRGSVLLAPFAPFVWLATRLALRSGRRTRRKEGLVAARPAVEEELKRLADSSALLFSRQLVMTARREPADRA